MQSKDLENGLELIKKKNSNYCFSVMSFPDDLQCTLKSSDNNQINMFDLEHLISYLRV